MNNAVYDDDSVTYDSPSYTYSGVFDVIPYPPIPSSQFGAAAIDPVEFGGTIVGIQYGPNDVEVEY